MVQYHIEILYHYQLLKIKINLDTVNKITIKNQKSKQTKTNKKKQTTTIKINPKSQHFIHQSNKQLNQSSCYITNLTVKHETIAT